ISITVLLGVLLIAIVSTKNFTKIVDDDIINISKLSSAMIAAEINGSLEGPIFVGQTMANDLFLKEWLSREGTADAKDQDGETVRRYLAEYSEQYGYDSVFLISARTGTYYFQGGVNKIVDESDPHDVWYYNFISSGKTYDLDVDVDEISGNQQTVFVNCRIEDGQGELLGVAGVGIRMSRLQELLKKHEGEYEMKAFLMDREGLVQVDSAPDNIETVNFFSEPKALAIKDRILANETSMELFWKSGQGSGYCLVTQYIERLDWYLVVQKNAEKVRAVLDVHKQETVILAVITIAVVLVLISRMVGKYGSGLVRAASIDGVTGLPNNKMFRQSFQNNVGRPGCGRGKLFIYDIDNFKSINDSQGHLYGNTVLGSVSRVARSTVGNRGIVARWGGDEFVGVIYGGGTETRTLVEALVKNISEIATPNGTPITISIGATELTAGVSFGELLHQADAAMYHAKKNGKNSAAYFRDLGD
ncbi:MAG: diguanylate cyclase, partial [Oscillospiraceae bacterium]